MLLLKKITTHINLTMLYRGECFSVLQSHVSLANLVTFRVFFLATNSSVGSIVKRKMILGTLWQKTLLKFQDILNQI